MKEIVGLLPLFWQVLLPNRLLNLVSLTVVPFGVQSTTIWLVSLLAGLILLSGCLVIAALVLKPGPAHFPFRAFRVHSRRLPAASSWVRGPIASHLPLHDFDEALRKVGDTPQKCRAT